MGLNISVKADQGISQYLFNLVMPKNLTALYKAFGKLTVNAIYHNIETEGAYFGHPWPGLAESTILQRTRSEGPNFKMLNRNQGDAGLLGGLSFNASADSVSVGFSPQNYYATYLHYGTDNMPARILFPGTLGSAQLSDWPQDYIEDLYWAVVEFISKRSGVKAK